MKNIAMIAFGVAACVGVSYARPALQGVDFDEDSITVTAGKAVIVKASVTTKNVQSGNTSSVVLYSNGSEVARAGGDHANDQLEYVISNPGDYDLKAVCSNSRADSDTCTVRVEEKKRKVF